MSLEEDGAAVAKSTWRPTLPGGSSLTKILSGFVMTSSSDYSNRQTTQPDGPVEDESYFRSPILIADQLMSSYQRFRYENDPVLIERSNLVNILKLVIREVLDSSLRFGRQLDSDHIPLQHFFIVLEHVLRHGFKPKKGLMGSKKELWDMLQIVEKSDAEAMDITSSIRDLPTVSTNIGRARAWVRLALMQKKLSDYFRILIGNGDLLREYYECDKALLRSEESVLIVGLLTSLNVVDCNLCLKEEDLDAAQGVIDFSLYLRSNPVAGSCISRIDSCGSGGDGGGSNDPAALQNNTCGGNPTGSELTAILDQKNYVEELNRNLTTTVANMQTKMENLTATHALTKEDLSIARNALLKSQEENRRLQQQLLQSAAPLRRPSSECSTAAAAAAGNGNKSSAFSSNASTPTTVGSSMSSKNSCSGDSSSASWGRSREELEKELKLQMSMKAEMEMAMKLLEKEVHEKQDTIVSLREQLDDIKHINLEMYTKLQVNEKSLRLKTGLVDRLEIKMEAMSDTLQKLDQKYVVCNDERDELRDRVDRASQELQAKIKVAKDLDHQLNAEREWRQSLQQESIVDKEKAFAANQQIENFKKMAQDYRRLQFDHSEMRKRIADCDATLEELGQQLSVSKLEVDNLQEEKKATEAAAAFNASLLLCVGGQWMDDSLVDNCQICDKDFSIARRKHHCRQCGGIFCDNCSGSKLVLPSSVKPVRVCDNCMSKLQD